MADLLNIGSSALAAASKGLDLTGHNIANVGTDGYSRQRVDQSARASGSLNRLETGGGVVVNGTQRINDALLESRLIRDGSEVARLDAFGGLAARADSLLSDSSSGLANALNGFFSGLEKIATDPASTATRQAALGAAQSLAGRFNDLHGALSAMDGEIDRRLTQSVATVNDLAGSVAQLNRRIALAGQSVPADLLDQRNTLVQQLGAQLGVTTLAQDDGSLNVFTSGGQPLVVGEKVTPLGTADDLYRPGRVEITSGNTKVSSQLSGGLIGGLLDARRTLIDPALEKLGRVAVSLATQINSVQTQGTTADGSAGAALFTAPTGRVFAASGNSGTGSASVGFGDLSQVTGDDYLLRSTVSGWQLTRAKSGESVAFTGSGSSADPIRVEGVTITLSGVSASGDSFRISPTHDAAGELRLATTDPAHFATAGQPSAGSGDNRNARALAAVAQSQLLDGGRNTLATANAALVTATGATALQVSTAKAAATAVQTQSQSERDAVSGVNLDEEAANLIRYQQAYQAAAQVIATAGTLFDTLIAATRR